jgi:hypothetical protein
MEWFIEDQLASIVPAQNVRDGMRGDSRELQAIRRKFERLKPGVNKRRIRPPTVWFRRTHVCRHFSRACFEHGQSIVHRNRQVIAIQGEADFSFAQASIGDLDRFALLTGFQIPDFETGIAASSQEQPLIGEIQSIDVSVVVAWNLEFLFSRLRIPNDDFSPFLIGRFAGGGERVAIG